MKICAKAKRFKVSDEHFFFSTGMKAVTIFSWCSLMSIFGHCMSTFSFTMYTS